MKRCERKRAILIGALACCVGGAAFAQSGRKPQPQPGQQPTEKPVARIETREVVVPLSAYDTAGRIVGDLAPQDVLVLEEGEARQVSYLKHEPANIVLVLDLSNEIGTFKNGPTQRRPPKDQLPMWQNYQVLPRPAAREFADNFVARLSESDQLAIIQYAERAQLIQDWTNDREQALTALRAKYRVGLKAGFHDALKLAAEKLEARPQGRRVIVLISDGLDTNSRASRQQALAAVNHSHATIFVIGWADVLRGEIESAIYWTGHHERQSSATADRITELKRHLPKLDGAAAQLRSLAENSGGELLLPIDFDEFLAAPGRVVNEIGAQYSLAFLTETKPSLESLRSIEVLPARRGLSVRSRRSYYVGDDAR